MPDEVNGRDHHRVVDVARAVVVPLGHLGPEYLRVERHRILGALHHQPGVELLDFAHGTRFPPLQPVRMDKSELRTLDV